MQDIHKMEIRMKSSKKERISLINIDTSKKLLLNCHRVFLEYTFFLRVSIHRL